MGTTKEYEETGEFATPRSGAAPTGDEERSRDRARWASGVAVVLGTWLLMGPFLLGYAEPEAALWNDVVVGTAIIVLAVVRLAVPASHRWASWTNVALGAWLVLAPFALGYSDVIAALVNDVVVGGAVALLAFASVRISRRVEHERLL